MAKARKPKSASTPTSSAKGAVGVDKRALMADALANGADDAAVLDHLIANGISSSAARYEVERLARDPMAAALRKMAVRQAKGEWVMTLADRLTREEDALQLPTIDAIDGDTFYRDYYALGRPVKLTGLISDWPALTRWSLDYFSDIAGDRVVEAQVMRDSAADYELAKDQHRRPMRFSEFVDWLRRTESSNDIYLTAYNTGQNAVALAPLWKDMRHIALLREMATHDGFLWIGPKGTLTPWHHDLTNNLLVQVVGEKRVQMAPPWAWARMRNSQHCFSDWGMHELTAGPGDATRPPVIETVIGPGEALFLPVGWWHAVEALSLSVSVSFTSFQRSNAHHEEYRSYGAM